MREGVSGTMIKKVLETIEQGEGLKIEFKESKNKLNRDVYETVCAFLNRNGGELFLGVKDNGEIIGVD
jgi:ATP-dependent DNA helicase RecG